jgi:hypothetical protein
MSAGLQSLSLFASGQSEGCGKTHQERSQPTSEAVSAKFVCGGNQPASRSSGSMNLFLKHDRMPSPVGLMPTDHGHADPTCVPVFSNSERLTSTNI